MIEFTDDEPSRMRAWVTAQFDYYFNKTQIHKNVIETSDKLIRGLYKDERAMELFIAPTQFGKTAVLFWTAYKLMTHVDPRFFVPHSGVFIMTGVNSNSWKEQTQSRILPCMHANVWHNKDVCKEENVERLKDGVLL